MDKLAPVPVTAKTEGKELSALLGFVACTQVCLAAEFWVSVRECALLTERADPVFPITAEFCFELVVEILLTRWSFVCRE